MAIENLLLVTQSNSGCSGNTHHLQTLRDVAAVFLLESGMLTILEIPSWWVSRQTLLEIHKQAAGNEVFLWFHSKLGRHEMKSLCGEFLSPFLGKNNSRTHPVISTLILYRSPRFISLPCHQVKGSTQMVKGGG